MQLEHDIETKNRQANNKLSHADDLQQRAVVANRSGYTDKARMLLEDRATILAHGALYKGAKQSLVAVRCAMLQTADQVAMARVMRAAAGELEQLVVEAGDVKELVQSLQDSMALVRVEEEEVIELPSVPVREEEEEEEQAGEPLLERVKQYAQ